jgi:2-polyprenyl-6-methoxyphenol hydroxylase-like FAD-dependent oxidoreductase
VIGADGKHSFVAEAVGAATYGSRPGLAFASYTYFSGVPLAVGELYHRPGLVVAAFPTNDNLTMVYAAAPRAGFDAERADLEAHFLAILDQCGDLGERVRAGVREERLRTAPDQPNTFRVPHGPGWALVGDAGVVMDSITAQGITNALRDAELLADAVTGGTLAGHRRRRDKQIKPMYDLTVALARFGPPGLAQRHLLAAIADRPAEVSRFLGAFAGIESPDRYRTPANLLRVLGARGAARLATAAAQGRLRRDVELELD